MINSTTVSLLGSRGQLVTVRIRSENGISIAIKDRFSTAEISQVS